MTGIAVRRIGAEEAGRAAPSFDRYRQFYGQAPDLVAAERFLSARLASGESTVFLAEDGQAVLGFAQVYPSFSSVRAAPLAILNDLYVEEGARRRGVGHALIGAVEAHARETGVLRLTLSTARDNRTAQRLYGGLGWEPDDQFLTFNRKLED